MSSHVAWAVRTRLAILSFANYERPSHPRRSPKISADEYLDSTTRWTIQEHRGSTEKIRVILRGRGGGGCPTGTTLKAWTWLMKGNYMHRRESAGLGCIHGNERPCPVGQDQQESSYTMSWSRSKVAHTESPPEQKKSVRRNMVCAHAGEARV
ncbi:hypothetical protein EJ02DRAFT_510620, partial [Clathrospora elynae]